jgi:RimJ/RimL family protein N-acetyltransferase
VDEKVKTKPILLDFPDRIETERLMLRVPRAGDGPPIFVSVRESLAELKMWMPWASDKYSPADSEEWCRRSAAQFLSREQLQFSILARDDGRHLGNIGVFKFNWEIPSCEIGYWLRTSECDKGFMTEAVGAVTRFCFESLKARRVQLLIDDENRRSTRVADRCGFDLEGTLRNDYRYPDGRLRDTRVYSRIAA